ncbi:SPOR domain-containing protein [Erwinia endophytica]|uniref:SPOR domain-containing protein n=1 Tax=Erwinia endophytica TaxID=1563158 RepID=UPI001265F803|nr:SPOR domain-containing protein [Erwinia endophytica]KAB8312368.1 SPOR domain-containing protein [Erwinia endophytica]
MDEFKSEDELKPDTSDRRPQRSRKTSSVPKVPVSRQHVMIGIGILVLLLLVLGIGSALNTTSNSSSSQQQSAQPGTTGGGNDKTIDLSGSSSMSGQPTAQQPASDATAADPASANPSAQTPAPAAAGNSPQVLSAPPVSSTPTQAAPLPTPTNQQRVELPGDLNNALANQQGQVDNAAQGVQNNGGSLPTAPATVAPGAHSASNKPVAAQAHQSTAHQRKPATSHRSPVGQPVRENKSKSSIATGNTAPATAKESATSLPGGHYTLQLSSASRADTLNAWAKKQNLSSYHVYKTTRNGQPWFVLVSGSYATSADAKRAVSSLPAEVRAQNPWVKPLSQVKKEASN